MIAHFAGLISVLQSEPSYTPNETDLQIVSLQTKLADLESKNNDVSTAFTAVSNARLQRNNTLYKEDEGLVPIAAEVKKYVKSVYGATAPEFKQITAIKFSKLKL